MKDYSSKLHIPKQLLTAIFPLLLVLYEVPSFLSNDMYLPALPQIMLDFGISHYLAELTITAWFLGSALLQLIIGPLADKYGRRPILLTGGLLFILSSLCGGTTHNILVFFICRFIQGLSVSLVAIPGYACINETLDQKRAIITFSWMASISVLTPAVGPFLGSLLLHFLHWNWRSLFYILTLWACVPLFLLYLYMPESASMPNQKSINYKELLSSYRSILTNHQFLSYSLIAAILFGGSIAWITIGPLMTIKGFHYRTIVFGFFQALIFGSFIICTNSVRILIKKLSGRSLIKLSIFLTLIGSSFALCMSLLEPSNLYALVIGLMIYTGGVAYSFSAARRLAIDNCTEPLGAQMAVYGTIIRGFGFIGSLSISFFTYANLSYLSILLFSASLLALGLFANLPIRR